MGAVHGTAGGVGGVPEDEFDTLSSENSRSY